LIEYVTISAIFGGTNHIAAGNKLLDQPGLPSVPSGRKSTEKKDEESSEKAQIEHTEKVQEMSILAN
jgi:hypothetical protein